MIVDKYTMIDIGPIVSGRADMALRVVRYAGLLRSCDVARAGRIRGAVMDGGCQDAQLR